MGIPELIEKYNSGKPGDFENAGLPQYSSRFGDELTENGLWSAWRQLVQDVEELGHKDRAWLHALKLILGGAAIAIGFEKFISAVIAEARQSGNSGLENAFTAFRMLLLTSLMASHGGFGGDDTDDSDGEKVPPLTKKDMDMLRDL